MKTFLDGKKVPHTELQGDERDKAVKDFLAGSTWYRGTDVDRLSEKEADIIGERLVKRVGAKVPLSGEKAALLKALLSQHYRRGFIRKPGEAERPTKEHTRDALLKAAGEHLDAPGVEALKEALAQGSRPAKGEK